MFREENGIFCLETEHLGYYMAPRGELMETLHFGGKLRGSVESLSEKAATVYGSAIPYSDNDDLLHLCLELSPTGRGDYRRTGLELRLADGSDVVQFRFVSHQVHEGSLPPAGMPGGKGAAQTVEWYLRVRRVLSCGNTTVFIPIVMCLHGGSWWRIAAAGLCG